MKKTFEIDLKKIFTPVTNWFIGFMVLLCLFAVQLGATLSGVCGIATFGALVYSFVKLCVAVGRAEREEDCRSRY